MAEEDLSLDDLEKDSKDSPGDGEKKGLNKKLIIIIAASALLLILSGVAAYFLLFSDTEEQTDTVVETVDGNNAERTIKEPVKGDAIYISVKEPFLVNIKSGKRSRMMQIRLQFMVRSKQAEDLVKKHMPLLRNDLLDYFSVADAEVVQTREGRNALKQGALETAQTVIREQAGFDAIEMVLFTGFVVQ